MLRHVAVFRWKDGTTDDAIQAVAEALGRLPEQIPTIAAYRFGPDLGLTDGSADFAVVADFASVEDWRAYTHHPAHQKLIEDFILPIRESRVVAQYEVEG
jgi:Stress responsive A/B Barrel Domain